MGVFVKFWGTRGSIPTPGSWTRVYGGNTSCVEVRIDDTVFICDAGSGIRELGKDLLSRKPMPRDLHLLISHTHWDHIQGFPFFSPAHARDFRIHLYNVGKQDDSRYALLSGQMSSSYFPVTFGDLQAEIVSEALNGGTKIDGVKVKCVPTNHPGGCFGYTFEKDGKRIAYITDNELEIGDDADFPDGGNTGNLRGAPKDLIKAVRVADLLITDAQYTDAEYEERVGWGHSSIFSATDFAIQAEVGALALFHHDPECSDEEVDQRVEACRRRAARFESGLVVFAAREGVELKL